MWELIIFNLGENLQSSQNFLRGFFKTKFSYLELMILAHFEESLFLNGLQISFFEKEC
jgi:hypothetical protein